MSRLAILLTFLTAFSVGWVPVFAAPVRLAGEMAVQSAGQMAGHAHACAGDQKHCTDTAKLPHPALCSACIAIPAIGIAAVTTVSTRMLVPHGIELPLIAQASAPLSPPPKPLLIASYPS
jgi:hypothetical protein